MMRRTLDRFRVIIFVFVFIRSRWREEKTVYFLSFILSKYIVHWVFDKRILSQPNRCKIDNLFGCDWLYCLNEFPISWNVRQTIGTANAHHSSIFRTTQSRIPAD